jgi:hypothetical protein
VSDIGSALVGVLPQIFVGGTLAALVSVLVNRKSERRKVLAEAKKLEAEADSDLVTAAKEIIGDCAWRLAAHARRSSA